MPHEIKLEKFDGPLDLLLQLIEQEKMSITDIVLSKITEQFLDFLDKITDDRSDNLADFLVIATRLVYLKSKNILPYLQPAEDEGPDLAAQLKLYKRFVKAASQVQILWQAGKTAYGRVESPVQAEKFSPSVNCGVDDLYNAMAVLIKRLQPLRPLESMRIDHTVSVKQKIINIKDLLNRIKTVSFREMLQNSQNKTEIIVSFLALLELLKEEAVRFKQGESYADLILEKI